MAEEASNKEEVLNDTFIRLGGGSVKIHMKEEHFDLAYRKALKVYRQKAENATEESVMILTLKEDTQSYILPSEVQEVRQILRRGYSKHSGGGSEVDPFELAYTNAYLLQAGRSGGLLTYELYHSYLETAGKMFGQHINFTWEQRTRKLTVTQISRRDEEVLLWCWNYTPDEVLLEDVYARPWLEDWTLAEAKEIEGQIRSKFTQFAGPSGGTTLNGVDLLSQSQQEKEKLLEELKNFSDGSTPMGWIHG